VEDTQGWEQALTDENMCATGEVTLIDIKPDTESNKPKNPVTTLPAKNTLASSLSNRNTLLSAGSSLFIAIRGSNSAQHRTFELYATWTIEVSLETCILRMTAWTAVINEERKP
jgi:hypothetical protein